MAEEGEGVVVRGFLSGGGGGGGWSLTGMLNLVQRGFVHGRERVCPETVCLEGFCPVFFSGGVLFRGRKGGVRLSREVLSRGGFA